MPKTTKQLTLSALLIALYVVTMFMTQSIAFGAYQIRIATAIYALAFVYPFLVLPLGLANLLSNLLFGGLGLPDIIGGFCVGIVTTLWLVQMKKAGLSRKWAALPVLLVPALGVAIWLSAILNIPYGVMALNLLVGQVIPAVVGVMLIGAVERVFSEGGQYVNQQSQHWS